MKSKGNGGTIPQARNPYAGNKAGMHKAPVDATNNDPKAIKVDGDGKDLRSGGSGKK